MRMSFLLERPIYSAKLKLLGLFSLLPNPSISAIQSSIIGAKSEPVRSLYGTPEDLPVFFLATKDETSRILKTFITELENQLDHKVKVIRSDNGTEFKNSIMNQFCEMKGIKREFSVARTPQQNGVAERKNRTLIEAARTMLVDSKLPTTFWAEAVNTACYVLNKVLVIKPHNKTPYELLRGRPLLIDFIKPFWCLVTILNTKDHLGKFDGKADEGYFSGYELCAVAAGLKDCEGDAGMKPTEVDENEASDKSGKHDQEVRSESERLNQIEMQTEHINSTNGINTISTPVSTAGPSFDTVVPSTPVNTIGPSVSTANESKEQLFETFSLFKNAFTLPPVLNISLMDNTGIFRNAYDDEDVEEEVDMNNVISSYTVPDTSFTKFHKDHLEDQVIGSLKTPGHTQGGSQPNGCEEFFSIWKDRRGGVCLSHPLGFEITHFPVKFYEVEDRALYGLHHSPRAMVEDIVYVDIIFGSTKKELSTEFEKLMHDKFQMSSMGELSFFLGLQTASTPMEPNKALIKDEEAEDVDVHLYRSMIGSLMYLTASRPDITFAVCACARFQVTPKTLHLRAMKRIFRYLKASLDMKSTTRGCQFLGKRLISWQCKKQTIVANSTPEAKYVAAANCYGQPNKYVVEILKKFDFALIKTASTPMETNKALIKDEEVEDVDVHLYRSMIGSLMYLTASRPDIMFVVCACAKFQVTPKTLHFNAVKMIFRYLKGQPIAEGFEDYDGGFVSFEDGKGRISRKGPKDSEENVRKKHTEVDESRVSDNGGQDDQRSELERLLLQKKQTEHINNTNSVNTVSPLVSTAGPSFANAAPSSSINAVGTPVSTSNAYEEHLFQ
ncbi:putative ribonuclease H-like domain-containing protein [Tanacetum coccineum]